MSDWCIIWSYIYQNRISYLCGVALIVAANLLWVLIPWLLGRFTDQLQHGSLSIAEATGYAAAVVRMIMERTCLT